VKIERSEVFKTTNRAETDKEIEITSRRDKLTRETNCGRNIMSAKNEEFDFLTNALTSLEGFPMMVVYLIRLLSNW
jgi:hypothetical protein